MHATGATKRHHCGGLEPPIQSLIERFSAGAFLLRCLQDRTPEIICVNDAFDEALGRWFGADFERVRPLAAERVFPEAQIARIQERDIASISLVIPACAGDCVVAIDVTALSRPNRRERLFVGVVQSESCRLDETDWGLQDHNITNLNDALKYAMYTSPDAVCLASGLDDDYPVVFANQAFEQQTGYTLGEIIGRNCRVLSAEEPDSPNRRRIRAAIAAQETLEITTLNRRKDGTPYYVRLFLRPLFDDAGRLTYYLAFTRDRDKERREIQALAHAERLRSIGALASGVAHEINNLLHPILNANDEIVRAVACGEDPRPFAEIVERSASHAATIVGDILTFAGNQGDEPDDVDVGSVLHDVRDLLTLQGFEDIEFGSVDAALRLRARRRGIVQVIMNLIQNAKDAAGPDGQFGIRCREERNAGSGEDWFVFSVWDTGPGIPQEVQERMFSPFFTTKRVGHGTGLGLSIVLGLVDQWGGRVEVKSAIGDGTVFDIYLKRLA